MKNKKIYQIAEYQSFAVSDNEVLEFSDIIRMDSETFNVLKQFVLTNKSKSTDALELMTISAKKNIGEIITAKNYVGVITLKNGTSIEILPKISKDKNYSLEDTKRVFIDMLKTLPNFNSKSLQMANTDVTNKMNIFEIFIRMFIDEVTSIAKKGLKSDYLSVKDNLNAIKGKILFSENIKYNYAHAERSFVEYSEFNINRPENIIVKTTLNMLYKKTLNSRNKKDIKTLLSQFDGIQLSDNIDNDFSKCKSDRNVVEYNRVLIWCKLFLKGESFTSYFGSNIAFALLFPMNDIFESYVANKVKKMFRNSDYRVSIQDKTHYLYSNPKAFLLKPDIVITSKISNKKYIFDTKWKLLDNSGTNYNISRGDIYQMYAYQNKYKAESVCLIYPNISTLSNNDNIKYEDEDNGDLILIKFISLTREEIQKSMKECFNIT